MPKGLFEGNERYLQGFSWPKGVTLYVGDCATGESEYSPATKTIQICLSDAISAYDLFAKENNTKAKSEEATKNTMVFIFLHEVGHALIDSFALPTTGSQEDAADEFAALALATQTNARLAGVEAAYWFLFRGRFVNQPMSWDAHDADVRRSAHIACLISGAQPGQYGPDLAQLGLQPTFVASCAQEYQRQREVWNYFLTPHLKRGSVWW